MKSAGGSPVTEPGLPCCEVRSRSNLGPMHVAGALPGPALAWDLPPPSPQMVGSNQASHTVLFAFFFLLNRLCFFRAVLSSQKNCAECYASFKYKENFCCRNMPPVHFWKEKKRMFSTGHIVYCPCDRQTVQTEGPPRGTFAMSLSI